MNDFLWFVVLFGGVVCFLAVMCYWDALLWESGRTMKSRLKQADRIDQRIARLRRKQEKLRSEDRWAL